MKTTTFRLLTVTLTLLGPGFAYAQLADPSADVAVTDSTALMDPTLVDPTLADPTLADDNAFIPLSGSKGGKKPPPAEAAPAPPHFDFTGPPKTPFPKITLVGAFPNCGFPNLVKCTVNGTHLDCTTGNGSHKITINGLKDKDLGEKLLSEYCGLHP